MRSSLGFHTMTLSLSLKSNDVPWLIKAFGTYSRNTGLIQIYQPKGDNKYTPYIPKITNDGTFLAPTRLYIKYCKEGKGIKWFLKCNHRDGEFTSYVIDVTINPKILGGVHDYITAATYDDMDAAIINFNSISAEISTVLSTFDCYHITRLDYCINFNVNELAPGCTPEQIMTLIRRADVPHHYTEWDDYNDIAHRTKSNPNSFYLKTSSVVINCYSKYAKLQEQTQQNKEQGYPPIPQTTLDAAKDIIRFEVQCKYHKTYAFSNRINEFGNSAINKYESLLAHVACVNVINDYFQKVIGKGDWYTLHNAIRLIESEHFNKQKEKRLIDALRLVNECRSLAKAKSALKGDELKTFKKTLKDLSSLKINPVTIPKWWGIKHIPNLLYAYYDKVDREESEKEMEEFKMNCLMEQLYGAKHLYI